MGCPLTKYREEVIGGQRLICGDCRDYLLTVDDEALDAIITDPPWTTTDFAFENDDAVRAIGLFKRVLHRNGNLVVVGSLPILAAFMPSFQYRWTGIWLKPNGTPRFHNSHKPPSKTELIGVFCQQGAKATATTYNRCVRTGEPWKKVYRNTGFKREQEDSMDRCGTSNWTEDGFVGVNEGTRAFTDVFEGCSKPYMPKSERTEHPTQKPVNVLCDLLSMLTNEGQTVCDPFMGSGTALVAAELMGRRGIGVELDPKFFDIACRRVEEAVRQAEQSEAQLTLETA